MKKFPKYIVLSALLGASALGFLSQAIGTHIESAAALSPTASKSVLNQGELVIKKRDNSNRPVSGSVFEISYGTGTFAKRVVTDKTGTARTLLPPGDYIIKDATAVAAGQLRGVSMFHVPVVSMKIQTVFFDKAYRELNGIW